MHLPNYSLIQLKTEAANTPQGVPQANVKPSLRSNDKRPMLFAEGLSLRCACCFVLRVVPNCLYDLARVMDTYRNHLVWSYKITRHYMNSWGHCLAANLDFAHFSVHSFRDSQLEPWRKGVDYLGCNSLLMCATESVLFSVQQLNWCSEMWSLNSFWCTCKI